MTFDPAGEVTPKELREMSQEQITARVEREGKGWLQRALRRQSVNPIDQLDPDHDPTMKEVTHDR